MSRPSISTPCPAPYALSALPGRRLSTTSIAGSQDDTADIDYTRPVDLGLTRAKPRRKSTFKRREQAAAPITIFEDVLEDEELVVEPRRPVGGSTLLARPAQKPTHRAVPRQTESGAERLQPLRSIGQAHGRQSNSPQHNALRVSHEIQTIDHTVVHKNNDGSAGKANAGLKKEPRRRTIFVPSDDTTLLTIHPGAQTTDRLNDTFQLYDLHLAPSPQRDQTVAEPVVAKSFKRPRLSMAVAPKRLPLASVAAHDVSNIAATDVAGMNGGKENVPPGGMLAIDRDSVDLKEKAVDTSKTSTIRSSLFQQTAASKARQSVVPRQAVPLPRSSTNASRAPLPTEKRSMRPAIPAQLGLSTQASTQYIHKSPPNPISEQRTSEKRSANHRQKLLDRKVPRLAQYPVLSEDLSQPELYEDSWLTHQEIALTEVVNQLYIDAEPENADWQKPKASLRERLVKVYHQERVTTLHRRLHASLLYGALSRPRDTQGPPDPALDIGLRKRFLSLWLDSYDHTCLRAAAEVVFGHQLPQRASDATRALENSLDPHKGRRTLIGFLETFLVELEDVEEPAIERGDDAHPRWRKMILRSLMLVWLLDQISVEKLATGCLFKSTSSRKSSTAVLQSLASMLVPSTGEITRVLRHLDYEVTYVQDPLDEVRYRIENIAVDLRDGVLLTRLVELLLFLRKQHLADHTGSDATVTIRMPDLTILESALRNTDDSRSQRVLTKHLKMPCIGRAQKVFNVEIAVNALRDHGRIADDIDEISALDIVNGHREKTLSLLWSLVSIHGLDQLVSFEELVSDIKRTSANAVELPADCTNLSQSEQESLLKKWASAHCAAKGIRIGNLTTAFADGRAYAAILEDFALYTSTKPRNNSTSSIHHDQLCDQLQAFGCSTAFTNQLTASTGTIPSRKTTISNLAFLASRLLPLARRQTAAIVIQRAFRRQHCKTIMSQRVTLMRLAQGCATVVQTHRKISAAVTVLQQAWRRVLDNRVEGLNSDVGSFQSLAKGWLYRRKCQRGSREQSMRVAGGW